MNESNTREKPSDDAHDVENNNRVSLDSPRQVQPNRVARRLPNGEIPTGKNTLRSFESSSYPQQVTSATAIVDSGKLSAEAFGDIINENELESTEFSGDDPILEAVAAPVLEEAEAILFEENDTQPENPSIEQENEDPTPRSKDIPHHKNRFMWIGIVVLLAVIGIVTVAVSVSCSDGQCRNGDTSKGIEETNDGIGDPLSSPTLSPVNSSSILGIISSPTFSSNSTSPKDVPTSEPSWTPSEGPSPSPTSVEEAVRTNMFIEFINVLSLSGRTIQNIVNGTPEDIALNWLITSDPWARTSLLETSSERFRVRQRYALLTLFFQQSAYMSSWGNTSGWLVDEDECNWYGINCTEVDSGNDAGRQMAVTSVNLQKQNIRGTVSSDLGLLSSMESFEIYDNALFGTIPDSLDQWTNLTTFYVYKNKLTGTLPFSMGQWSKLQQFSAAFNQLTGTLPLSIDQWTDLLYFSVANNQLNGTLSADIGQWTNLDVFILRHNLFSGTLPSTIGQWTQMKFFNITENQISGTIPDTISRWSNLQTLTLRDNVFTGTLPSSIGTFTKMWFFDVSSNFLTGTIPVSVGNWSGRLKEFRVEQNNFTGLVPIEFCNETIATVIHADCELVCDCCTQCF